MHSKTVNTVRKDISSTIYLYEKFLNQEEPSYTWPSKIQLRGGIIILTSEELNDTHLFAMADDKSVLGRFFPEKNLIYITSNYLDSENTIILHELVHLINSTIGITDQATDEKLAYGFEQYYMSLK